MRIEAVGDVGLERLVDFGVNGVCLTEARRALDLAIKCSPFAAACALDFCGRNGRISQIVRENLC